MAETYTKTAYADLQSGDVVIITMQKGTDVFAASNDQGTTKAPVAKAVTVADDAITTDSTNILWTVVKDGDNISFQAGEAYLYCTNTNNGVRVGSGEAKVFSIDATSGYLYNNGTSRYIGVYNSQDFRCYTTVNSNISGQTLAFYAVSGTPVVGQPKYYVAGNMNEWKANANYKLSANPAVDGEYMGEFTFAANDEFKVIMDNGSADYTWYPEGMGNNWVVNQDGDYMVYFRPAGNTEWANGFFNVIMKEKPVIPTYNVAEAIAAGLTDNTEINVRGIITKMEFKGKNFAQYGSVNIYVADATGAEGTFEFYNCYSLNADTFKTSTPAYDATSTAYAEFTEVADANGNAIHIGDTVIAFGKYKLYNTTHELNTGCNLIEIKHKGDTPQPVGVETIYDWAGEIGTTVFGGNSNITTGTVKIHENTDDVNGIKFGSSYVYADGKWIAIKAKEGGFKAGDVLSVSVVFNNSDVTKYCMADVYAADQTTRLFRSDSASTLNGRNAGEPIVQTYTLEADQDSLLLGRYGNTGMFITLLKVERALVPPTPEPTYTVAGSSATLFGTTWDPTNTDNDLAPITGSEYLYAWSIENVTLAAGEIAFKVCENHAWDKAWPAQDYKLNIAEAGVYKVAIFFNPALEAPVYAEATKTGEAVVLPNIILHGNFTGSWADTEAFTPASDSLTASLTLALAEGTYEFGFKFDGAWKANGANITREANTANLSTGEGNMHIAADVPGNYIFTYTYATQDVVVTYPNPIIVPDTIDVTISSLTAPGSLIWDDEVATAGWWQIMGANETCEFSLSNGNTISTAAGTYTVADLDADYSYITVVKANDTIDVAFVDGSITVAVNEAGVVTIVGALLGNDDNVYNFNLTYVDPKAETTVNVTISNGSLIDDYATYGLYGAYGYSDDKTAYVQLGIWAENGFQGNFTEDDLDLRYIGSFVATQAGSIRIFSAAVTVTPGNLEGEYSITADLLCYNNTLYKVTMTIGAAQGIDAVEAATKAIKSLKNGILTIEKAGKTYNVNGTLIR